MFCPVSAIRAGRINQRACVECGVCVRDACRQGAIRRRRSPWPRAVRALFSDPTIEHRGTGVPGRGTEESKTNDVTNRIRPGRVGLNIELGRPCVGTSFRQVQQVTRRLARLGVEFEKHNPLTPMMSDGGRFPRELLGERVLSVLVEVSMPVEALRGALAALWALEKLVRTVFSVSVVCRWADRPRALAQVDRRRLLPQAKINVGMAGRR